VTFKSALFSAEAQLTDLDIQTIILNDSNWHPGVIGIVASRLVEKYYKPTILLTKIDGVWKGSARSIESFNIFEALRRTEAYLLQYGGHKYAAGLAIEDSNLDAFKVEFTRVAAEMLTEDILRHEIYADAMIRLSDITPRFMRILKQFAPFGPGNMRPVFYTHDVEVYGEPRIVGRDHLKLKLTQDGTTFDVIGFNLGSRLDMVSSPDKRVDILFTIEENSWNGNVFPQLKLRDVRRSDDPRIDEEILQKAILQQQ
jgi:single-stranded-DNA-specific exonuclease